MQHGYYWLHLKYEEPEVVEIDGESMYRCGSDVTCHLEDGRWIEFGEALDVVEISGPLVPPNGKAQVITVARPLANEREKMGADTIRMNWLELQDVGRYDEVSGPDVFAVMFRFVEPGQDTLRDAVDAAMAAEERGA